MFPPRPSLVEMRVSFSAFQNKEITVVTPVANIKPTAEEKIQIRSLLDEIIDDKDMSNQYAFIEKSVVYAQ
jgi:hypothetical protein